MDRTRGYTLLELMMVVVIMGICVAMALPIMSTAVAEQSKVEAAAVIGNVYRDARATAMQRGTPTLVWFAAPGTFWIIPAPRDPGVTTSCGTVDWLPLVFPLPPAELDLAAGRGPENQDFGFDRYTIGATSNVAALAVCYSPLGRVYVSTAGPGGPYSDLQAPPAIPGGAVTVDVTRPDTSPRSYTFPLGTGILRPRY